MTTIFSNYLGNLVLETWLRNGNTWLALHTDDPTPAGDPATEAVGGGYARQLILFGAASNRTVASVNEITFTDLPLLQVHYLAIWNAPVGGSMKVSYQIPTQYIFASGQLLAAPGDITLAI